MPNRIPFHKTYTNSHDLVSLLQSRGLTINDQAKSERYLEYICYYRLSAYMYPLLKMPKEQHQYKQGTSFSQVMTLYRFNKKLRLFIFNEIEKIEVAVRSAIVNTGSELTGIPSPYRAALGMGLIRCRAVGTLSGVNKMACLWHDILPIWCFCASR